MLATDQIGELRGPQRARQKVTQGTCDGHRIGAGWPAPPARPRRPPRIACLLAMRCGRAASPLASRASQPPRPARAPPEASALRHIALPQRRQQSPARLVERRHAERAADIDGAPDQLISRRLGGQSGRAAEPHRQHGIRKRRSTAKCPRGCRPAAASRSRRLPPPARPRPRRSPAPFPRRERAEPPRATVRNARAASPTMPRNCIRVGAGNLSTRAEPTRNAALPAGAASDNRTIRARASISPTKSVSIAMPQASTEPSWTVRLGRTGAHVRPPAICSTMAPARQE